MEICEIEQTILHLHSGNRLMKYIIMCTYMHVPITNKLMVVKYGLVMSPTSRKQCL